MQNEELTDWFNGLTLVAGGLGALLIVLIVAVNL